MRFQFSKRKSIQDFHFGKKSVLKLNGMPVWQSRTKINFDCFDSYDGKLRIKSNQISNSLWEQYFAISTCKRGQTKRQNIYFEEVKRRKCNENIVVFRLSWIIKINFLLTKQWRAVNGSEIKFSLSFLPRKSVRHLMNFHAEFVENNCHWIEIDEMNDQKRKRRILLWLSRISDQFYWCIDALDEGRDIHGTNIRSQKRQIFNSQLFHWSPFWNCYFKIVSS